MNAETFGALRRALTVARKCQRDADTFENDGHIESAHIADAAAYGIYKALRAALYAKEETQ